MIKAYFLMENQDISVPLKIRDEVFVKEQGFSAELEHDDIDATAIHVVIEDEDGPCGTGRLFYTDGGWHIGRMAVLKEKRGKKYGDLLVRMLVDKALNAGVEEIFVGAQLHAKGFYEKMGCLVCGEGYEEEGCPHVPMVLPAQRAIQILFSGCGGCGGGDCESCEKNCGGKQPAID